jgi:hypothetical protein
VAFKYGVDRCGRNYFLEAGGMSVVRYSSPSERIDRYYSLTTLTLLASLINPSV